MAFASEQLALTTDETGVRLEAAGNRLREIQAILGAIDAGNLFAELPCPAAARHQIGVALLEIMNRELTTLIQEFDELVDEPLGSRARN